MEAPPRVAIEALRLSYSSGPVLEIESLKVGAGETLGVLGENGSGKSSLLALLGGRATPSQGRVRIQGSDPWSQPSCLEGVGWVGHESCLDPYETGLEYLELAETLSPDQAFSLEALEEAMGLRDLWEARGKELSRGQGRWIELAASLLRGRDLLLWDEPRSGLDARRREILPALCTKFRPEASLILTGHQLEDLAGFPGTRVVLRAGRLEESSPESD